MDFMQRGGRPTSPVQNNNRPENEGDSMNQQSIPGHGTHVPSSRPVSKTSNMRFAIVTLLFSITLLMVLVLAYLGFSRTPKLFEKTKMQAVFLNGGQVYFGNLSAVNDKYIKLSNIYYLRVDQQVQPQSSTATNQNVSLAKLGCELHGPEDSMVINREQVLFWEDLKNGGNDQDGQVVKAVKDFVKANPQGQKCTANTGNGTNTPGAGTPTATPSPTTPTTPSTVPTKKP